VVTSETGTLGPMTEPVGGLSLLFNNVVLLRYLEMDSQTRQAINIVKMRNSNHDKGVFEFLIGERGFGAGSGWKASPASWAGARSAHSHSGCRFAFRSPIIIHHCGAERYLW